MLVVQLECGLHCGFNSNLLRLSFFKGSRKEVATFASLFDNGLGREHNLVVDVDVRLFSKIASDGSRLPLFICLFPFDQIFKFHCPLFDNDFSPLLFKFEFKRAGGC